MRYGCVAPLQAEQNRGDRMDGGNNSWPSEVSAPLSLITARFCSKRQTRDQYLSTLSRAMNGERTPEIGTASTARVEAAKVRSWCCVIASRCRAAVS